MQSIDIVFDGPPSHDSPRLVEVEDGNGKSVRIGEWIERDDGFWALRISASDITEKKITSKEK